MQYQHFSREDREALQQALWKKKSIREIAHLLGQAPSSVSREINRHNPSWWKRYTPHLAHERALERRKSKGRQERLKNDAVRTYVRTHMKLGWSPEQIAATVKKATGTAVSHEAVYQYV